MITANELRISNWVYYGGYPRQVTLLSGSTEKIGIDGTITLVPIIDPIPLTPEILEMCGFKETEDRLLSNDKFDMLKWFGNSLAWCAYNPNYKQGFTVVVYLKYLHQLQNLYFALTGEELKVNFHVEAAN